MRDGDNTLPAPVLYECHFRVYLSLAPFQKYFFLHATGLPVDDEHKQMPSSPLAVTAFKQYSLV